MTQMEAREHLKESLMGHEGLVLKVYDDATGRVLNSGDTVKGFATIGYGRNLMGRGISKAEADHLLDNDMTAVEAELDRVIPWWRELNAAREVAVLELAFNMGAVRFVTGWPNFVLRMKTGDWLGAVRLLTNSRWRQQVGETRYQAIAKLILTGVIA